MPFQNRSAYGEIFQIPTNYIDGIANKVWQEQKIREQQKMQQDRMLDDEFAKNVAGVKSADIPEITAAYNKFKQAHIALQKKGQKATPQDQMNVMIEKANAFQAINGSKEEKERVKNIVAELKADKKGKYIPTAHEIAAKRLNTPTSQVKDEDFDIRNKYSFPEMADFTKRVLGTAKPKKINLTTPSKKGELYDDKEVYQEFNNPNKMYEDAYIQGSSMANKDGFINTMLDSLDDNEKEALKERYFAKVSSPEFKKIYGEVKPFPESAGKTDLGEATALMVMGMVDKLPTTPQETISELNADRKAIKDKAASLANAKTMAGINDAYIRRRMKLNQSYKMAYKEFTAGVDAATDEQVLNKFIGNMYDNSGTQNTASIGGKEYKGRAVDLPKDIKDKYIFSAGNTDEAIPDKWLLTDDKKTLIPLFYGEKTSSGGYKLKTNPNSKPIDIQNFKVDLGKILLTQKQRGGEVVDQFDVPEVQVEKQGNKPAKTKTVTVTSSKQTIPNF
jgi:hypothetical protein